MSRQDIAIEVASDPRLLHLVRNLVRGYLEEAGFSRERADEVVLGVDEACTNAIRHSCGGNPNDSFRVSSRIVGQWLEIQLEDSGEPAPPEAIGQGAAPPIPTDAESLRPGGLGVHLIHQVFDEVEFCPGPTRGNCVTMKLRLPK